MIDTNIVLDSIGNREPYVEAAQKIFIFAANKKIDASLTASTVSDIYYIANKYMKNSEITMDIIKKLLTIFNIVSVDKKDCIKACETGMMDYEDSLLAICAVKIKCEYIVTRNKRDFDKSPVSPINPDDFLNLIK